MNIGIPLGISIAAVVVLCLVRRRRRQQKHTYEKLKEDEPTVTASEYDGTNETIQLNNHLGNVNQRQAPVATANNRNGEEQESTAISRELEITVVEKPTFDTNTIGGIFGNKGAPTRRPGAGMAELHKAQQNKVPNIPGLSIHLQMEKRVVGQEPPPAPPTFKLTPMKLKKETGPPPSPSLVKPSIEAVETKVLQTVDNHAIQVSKSHHESVRELVWDLVYSKNITNEHEICRVIFRWLATKNLKEISFDNVERGSPEEVLIGLKTDKTTYAMVFDMMCNYAGLHSKIICGYAKDMDYKLGQKFQPGSHQHSWNAVCIYGTWCLIDVSWAARRTIGKQAKAEELHYQLDEYFFLTKPAQLIYTHFPDDPKWQLLEHEVNQEEFENMPHIKTQFFKYGLEFVSHRTAVAYGHGEVTIRLRYPAHRLVVAFNFSVIFENGNEEYKSVNLNRYGMQESIEGVASIRLRLPKKGSYILDIYANEYTTENKDNVYAQVCEYKIVQKDVGPEPEPFPPAAKLNWGPNEAFFRYGLATDRQTATVLTREGKAEIQFRIPKHMQFIAKLKSNHFSDAELDVYCINRIEGNTAYFNINAPSRGEYGIEIYSNDPSCERTTLFHVAQYLIECNEDVKAVPLPILPPIYRGGKYVDTYRPGTGMTELNKDQQFKVPNIPVGYIKGEIRHVGQEPPVTPPTFKLIPINPEKEWGRLPSQSHVKPSIEAMETKVLLIVDDHAIQVSKSDHGSVRELVWDLVYSKNITKELEICRVIFRWLATNTLKELSFANVECGSPEELLIGLKAGKTTYAMVFDMMCNYAGLHSKLISGYAKGVAYTPGQKFQPGSHQHTWNAVYIDGTWCLIDADLAARRITGNRTTTEELHYQLNEYFFLTEPDQLIFTHFPDDPKWQLLERQVNQEEFENMTNISTEFFKYGLEFVSHRTAVACGHGEIHIRLRYPAHGLVVAFNFSVKFETGEVEYKGVKLNSYVVQESCGGLASFKLRLPMKGSYILYIYAKEDTPENKDNAYDQVCEYKIVQEDVGSETKPISMHVEKRYEGQEPPPTPPTFKLTRMKPKKETGPPPSPSHVKPIIDALDKKVLLIVDDHAIQVSKSDHGSVRELIWDLVYSKNITKELEICRVIFRWLATKNLKEMSFAKVERGSPEEVLIGLKTDKTTYAMVFDMMCYYAGLHSNIITGYAKGVAYKPGQKFQPGSHQHTWNTVYINGTWCLIDADWAVRRITGKRTTTEELHYQLDEYFFLTEPDQLIYTHFPDDPKWQLLEHQLNPEDVENIPHIKSQFFKYGLEFVSHRTAVAYGHGEIHIRLRYPADGLVLAFNVRVMFETGEVEYKGVKLNSYVVQESCEGLASFKLRLPKKGSYILYIYANEDTPENKDNAYDQVCEYKIVQEDVGSETKPIPMHVEKRYEGQEPPPTPSTFKLTRMKPKKETGPPPSPSHVKPIIDALDKKGLLIVDDHAIQVSKSDHGSVRELIWDLVYSKNITKELEICRVIFRWLATKNLKEMSFAKVERGSPEEVLIGLKTDKTTYAMVFDMMCYYAGLHSNIISGYAKGVAYKPGQKFQPGSHQHTWNAVYINGTWCLIDADWAVRRITGKRTTTEELHYQLDEYFFLTEPDQLIYTHFPDDPKWQLLEHQLNPEDVENIPHIKSQFFKYGLEFVSHRTAVAYGHGEIHIRLRYPADGLVLAFNVRVMFETGEVEYKGVKLNSYVVQESCEGLASFKLRLPKKGSYILYIYANEDTPENKDNAYDQVCEYKIVQEDVGSETKPIPMHVEKRYEGQEPSPTPPTFKLTRMKPQKETGPPPSQSHVKPIIDALDKKGLLIVDDHAIQVSKSDHGSVRELIWDLVYSKNITKELEICRVIFRWLATKNLKEMSFAKVERGSPEEVLIGLKTDKTTYAMVFDMMCYYAGLHSNIISGYAKGVAYKPGQKFQPGSHQHTWNAVYINGTWCLIDADWAVRRITGKRTTTEELHYQLDEYFFLTEPDQLIYTHFPDDPKWQLLEHQLNPEDVENIPHIKSQFFKYGLEFVSHRTAVAYGHGEIHIRLRYPADGLVLAFNVRVMFETGEVEYKGVKLNSYVVQESCEGLASFKLRLPKKGSYILYIYANEDTPENKDNAYDQVCEYKIVQEDVGSETKPIPMHVEKRYEGQEPPPTPSTFKLTRMKPKKETGPPPSPSHVKPIIDALDKKGLLIVDDHAIQVSKSDHGSVRELIWDLVYSKNITKELEICRVIFRWLATKNLKEMSFAKVERGSPEEVLIGLKTDKTTYAMVFDMMCYYAGLHSNIISGYAKGVAYKPGQKFQPGSHQHTWNAVYINGTWCLIDADWAVRRITGKRTTTEELHYQLDEYFFLTEPDQLIYTHFPDDPKWQLLEHQLNPEDVENIPHIKSQFFKYGLEFVSHRTAVAYGHGEIHIRLRYPADGLVLAFNVRVMFETGEVEYKGVKLNSYVVQESCEGLASFKLRLPKKGSYILYIYANEDTPENKDNAYDQVCEYKIVQEDVGSETKPIPMHVEKRYEGQEPSPTPPTFKLTRMKPQKETGPPPSQSHVKPIIDALDKKGLLIVDDHAIQVSKSDHGSVRELIWDLVYSKNITKELEICRVIFRWLATKNLKEMSFAKVERGSPEEVLIGLKTDKTTYAMVFDMMCYYAGLHSNIISGYAKGVAYKPGQKFQPGSHQHTWNAVYINGTWCLIDADWAVRRITGKRTTTEELHYQLDEYFFLTEPDQLIYTHFPDDPKWQLLEHQLNPEDVENIPHIKSQFFKYGLEFVSHRTAVAYGHGEIHIRLRYPADGLVLAFNVRVMFETGEVEYKGVKLNSYVVQESCEGLASFKLRLPKKGSYILYIYANEDTPENKDNAYDQVCEYKIVQEDVGSETKPIPMHVEKRYEGQEPPPTPPTFKLTRMKPKKETGPPPSPSHVKPIIDALDKKGLLIVDDHAIQVSKSDHGSVRELIWDLVYSKNITKELEICRVIFRWLATKNLKEMSFAKVECGSPEEVLIGLKTDKTTYAMVFDMMCYYAGLHSNIISGYAKGVAYKPGQKFQPGSHQHTWNAVYINGTWCLIDADWAVRRITGKRTTTEELHYQLDEYFFLTEPDQLIYTHFPDDPKWQLLEHQLNPEDVENIPHIKSQFFKYGLEFVSHRTAVVYGHGEIHIRLRYPAHELVLAFNVRVMFETGEVEYKGVKLNSYVVQESCEGLASFKLRLPKKGSYILYIYANEDTPENKDNAYDQVCEYKIVQEDVGSETKPIPMHVEKRYEGQEPPPTPPTFKLTRMKPKKETGPPPSPSHVKPIIDALDKKVLLIIDDHAIQVSKSDHGSVRKLIWDLVYSKNITKELEICRVIFRWLATKNLKEMSFAKVERGSPEEVLIGLKTDKTTYAMVFDMMCYYAGLHSNIISGYAKGVSYKPGQKFQPGSHQHTWNAVYIYGTWYLIDADWAARRITGKRTTTEELHYQLDEYFFLTEPDQLIYTHLPDDPKWQLLEHQLNQEDVENMPHMKSQFFKYGLEFVSHRTAVAYGHGEIHIRLRYPAHGLVLAFNVRVMFETGEVEYKGVKLNSYVVQESCGGVASFKLRLPKKGSYILYIYAKEDTPENKNNAYDQVCEYKIVQEDAGPESEPIHMHVEKRYEGQEPPPAPSTFKLPPMKPRKETGPPPSPSHVKPIKDALDKKVQLIVDDYAIQVSKSDHGSVRELVWDLVYFKNITKELEKCRVIFRWLATKNLKEISFDNVERGSPEEVLIGLKTDKTTYAMVFDMMCNYAGLNSKLISGYAKGVGYTPGQKFQPGSHQHTWNAVYINGTWCLIDADWAARRIIGKQTTTEELHYQLDEYFFLTEPAQLIYTHFPVDPKWQLMERQLNQEDVENMPHMKSQFFKYGLEFVSHRTAVAYGHGEIHIRLRYPAHGLVLAFLVRVMFENGEVEYNDVKLNSYVMQESCGGVASFKLRLPKKGSYILCINAKEDTPENKDNAYDQVCEYKIVQEEVGPEPEPFPPADNPNWGPSAAFVRYSITTDQQTATVLTREGKVELQFHIPKPMHFMATLTSNHFSDAKLEEHCIYRIMGNTAYVNINAPSRGEYGIMIYANDLSSDGTISSDGTTMFHVAQYIIECNEDVKVVPFPKLPAGYLGAQPEFYEFGLTTLSHHDPLIHLEKNTVDLQFSTTQEMRVTADLIDADSDKDFSDFVFTQTQGSVISFVVTLPNVGFYKMKLYSIPAQDTNQQLHGVFNYLINCKSITQKAIPFPKKYAQWKDDCYIETPLVLHSGCGNDVVFRVKVPKAEDVAVIADGDWTHMTSQQPGMWEGKVNMGKHYGNNIKVTLSAKYGGESTSYATLLEYKVCEYKIVQEDAGPESEPIHMHVEKRYEGQEPPPAPSTFKLPPMKPRKETGPPPSPSHVKPIKDALDKKVQLIVDDYAIQVSKSDHGSVRELVWDLVYFKNITKELEKCRVIFRWLATKNLKEISFDNVERGSPEEVLIGLKTDKTTYAMVFDMMCNYAGLNSKLISGYAKGVGYTPGQKFQPGSHQHTWNAVYINGTWCLIDADWAARRIIGKQTTTEELHYQLDEYFFLTEPAQLIYTHFPVDPKWQLMERQLNQEDVENMPHMKSQFFKYGLEFVSHRTAVAYGHGEIHIRLRYPAHGLVLAFLVRVMFENGEVEYNDVKLNSYVMQESCGGVASFKLRLPKKGSYILCINAKEDTPENKDNAYDQVCEYKIVQEEVGPEPEPFPPADNPNWGPSAAFVRYSITTDQQTATVLTREGKVELQFHIPKPMHFMATLTSNHFSDAKLEEHCIYRIMGNTAYVNINAPSRGEYGIMIYANDLSSDGTISSDGTTMFHVAQYIIECNEDVKVVPFPKLPAGYLGAQPEFYEFGLTTLSHHDPLIHLEKNTVDLQFSTTQEMRVTADLIDADSDKDFSDFVFTQTQGSVISFVVTLPNVGFYKMKLYSIPAQDTNQQLHGVFNYLINCKSITQKAIPFPKKYAQWKDDCYIETPLVLHSGCGNDVVFRVKVPKAEDVAVIADGDWTHMTSQQPGMWEGKVNMGKHYGNNIKVTLSAKYGGESTSYATLLEYKVCEYKIVQEDAGPESEPIHMHVEKRYEGQEPPPAPSTFKLPPMKPRKETGPPPSPSHVKPIKDALDKKVQLIVDDYAIQVSKSDHGSVRELVWDLVYFKNITKELEKCRVIFRWLATKNLKEISFDNVERGSPEEVLIGLKTDKTTYAMVFDMMCNYAGLNSKLISGYAKGVGYTPGQKFQPGSHQHTWNAVYINGTWCLIDADWAARRIIGKQTTTEELHYQLDEYFFLTEPAQLIYTHFPVDPKWQLMERQLNQEDVENMPHMKSQFFKYGLEFVSHRTAVAYGHGEIHIRLRYPAHGLVLAFLVRVMFENGEVEYNDVKLNSYVMQESCGGVASFKLRLPKKGSYILCINAKEDTPENKDNAYDQVCEYKIVQEEVGPEPEPFPPADNPNWGPSAAFVRYSITTDQQTATVLTREGKVELQFHIPKPMHFMATLTSNHFSDAKLEEHCIYRIMGNTAYVNINAPSRGEYGIMIYANDLSSDGTISSDGTTMFHVAQYIIECNEDVKVVPFPKLPAGYLGAQPEFYEFGLTTLSHHDPLIHLEKNTVDLQFSTTQEMRVTADLIDADSDKDFSDFVFTQTQGSVISFVVTLPNVGFYKMKLYSIPAQDTNQQLHGVFNYLINCKSITQKAIPFPKKYAQWKDDCYIETPLVLHSGCGNDVVFRVKVPKAEDVAVIADGDWTHMTSQQPGMWEGKVNMGKHYGNNIKVTLSAKYGGESTSYATLLEYKVCEYKIVQEDAGPESEPIHMHVEKRYEGQEPPPAPSTFKLPPMKPRKETGPPPSPSHVKPIKDALDKKVQLIVDDYAIQVSKSDHGSVRELVWDLVYFKNITKELEKCRVIFRWLATKNLKEISFDNVERGSPEEVLIGLKTDKTTYAMVFDMMCNYAGLNSKLISGYAKGVGYTPGQKFQPGSHQHTWNAVYINGTWCLIDADWAARRIIGKQTTTEELHYQLDEYFFLTEPAELIYTHFPVDPKWQLMERQLNQEDVENMPHMKSQFFKYGLEFVSHRTAVAYGHGEIHIRLRYPAHGLVLAFLVRVMFENGEVEYNDVKLNSYVMQESCGGVASFKLRLPKKGSYILCINAKEDTPENKDNAYDQVCEYKIVQEEVGPEPEPFPPADNPNWGPSAAFVRYSITTDQQTATVLTREGKVELQFHIPKPMHFMATLTSNHFSDAKLEEHCIYRIMGYTAYVNINAPSRGEYGIMIYANDLSSDGTISSDGTTMFHVAQYIIECNEDVKVVPFPKLPAGYLGAQPEFYEFGLTTLSHHDPLIHLEKNTVDLQFSTTQEMRVTADLIDADSDKDFSDFVFTQTQGSVISFVVTLPNVGFYKMKLYSIPAQDTNQQLHGVFNYLINCKSITQKAIPFPKKYAQWKDDCYIETPLVLHSGCGNDVVFRVKVPKAEGVAVIADGDWTHMTSQQPGMWEGKVNMGKHYGNNIKVTLSAKYGGESTSYATLLEYKV